MNKLKCPRCNSTLLVSGSECYPEDGVELECSNIDCAYEGPELKYNKNTGKLKQALVAAYKVLED